MIDRDDEYPNGPECDVCYQPIGYARGPGARFHAYCHRVYRKHYKRLRDQWIAEALTHPDAEVLAHIREDACQLAAVEVDKTLRAQEGPHVPPPVVLHRPSSSQ